MMHLNTTKLLISAAELDDARQAHAASVRDFMNPASIPANVVGMGVGVKFVDGQPTGEPAIIVLVSTKYDSTIVSQTDMVPQTLAGMQTDVIAVGHPFAGSNLGILRVSDGESIPLVLNATAPDSPRRQRPLRGGCSIGHFQITAGTVATCVYDIQQGGTINPPSPGIGAPSKFYILSNNHVLANVNDAAIGDPILQPGPFDGGTDPGDRVATLSRFVPITLEPNIPRDQHRNLVDAAIAVADFDILDREINWIGGVRGWRSRTDVNVGLDVKKTGRSSHFSTGKIVAVNVTIDVGYSGGRVGRFFDQIVTTAMSAPGDSGSLIVGTDDNRAVGLLFAGSPVATIANQFENVRSALMIEVWP